MKRKRLLSLPLVALTFLVGACSLIPQTRSSHSMQNIDGYDTPELRKIYDGYLANGGYLSYEDWLESIRGENGKDGVAPKITIGANGNYYIDGVDTGVSSKGEKGDTGDQGQNGQNGKDAESPYEQYKKSHPEYTGSEQDFYDDLARGAVSLENYHTVIFDSAGGSEIELQLILHGEKVNKPADPTKIGYSFDGWYYGDLEWSFTGLPVTEDMTLVAHWINPLVIEGNKIVSCDQNATSIVITEDIVSIAENAFNGCYWLNYFYYHGTIDSWLAFEGKQKFDETADEVHLFLNGDADETKDIVIPNTITEIGRYAFMNCVSIESVIIPSNVARVEFCSFLGCKNLKAISYPDTLSITASSFLGCESLEWFDIPSGTGFLNNDTFAMCYSLKYVVIPTSIDSIHYRVFENCTSLVNIFYKGTETQWRSIRIYDDEEHINSLVSFYSEEKPSGEGKHWHYVEGVPTIW